MRTLLVLAALAAGLAACSVPALPSLFAGCPGKSGTTHLCFSGQALNGQATIGGQSCALGQSAGQMTVEGTAGGKAFLLLITPAGRTPKEVQAFGSQPTARLQVAAKGALPYREVGTSHDFQLGPARATFKSAGIPSTLPTVYLTGEVVCPAVRPLPVQRNAAP